MDAPSFLPLLELMVLDDTMLPMALNCAADEGWSQVLLFLLETDKLRFPHQHEEEEDDEGKCAAMARLLETNAGSLQKHRLLSARDAASLRWLARNGIPLDAALAGVCEAAWWGVALPHCKQWPGRTAVQRQILGDQDDPAYPLTAVLASPELLRPYLARFLRARCAHVMPCYECWVAVRSALARLDKLKTRGDAGRRSPRPRPTDEPLQPLPLSLSQSPGTVEGLGAQAYDDPPAALALLLAEARGLARRLATPPTETLGGEAGAVSESLRLEISAALHETAAVGPADAAALDPAYAAAHCARLEHLLAAAEGEALRRLQVGHTPPSPPPRGSPPPPPVRQRFYSRHLTTSYCPLQAMYPTFVASQDHLLMAAAARAAACPAVVACRQRQRFLEAAVTHGCCSVGVYPVAPGPGPRPTQARRHASAPPQAQAPPPPHGAGGTQLEDILFPPSPPVTPAAAVTATAAGPPAAIPDKDAPLVTCAYPSLAVARRPLAPGLAAALAGRLYVHYGGGEGGGKGGEGGEEEGLADLYPSLRPAAPTFVPAPPTPGPGPDPGPTPALDAAAAVVYVVGALGPRACLQLCMLLLANTPLVLVAAHAPARAAAAAALPALLRPFRCPATVTTAAPGPGRAAATQGARRADGAAAAVADLDTGEITHVGGRKPPPTGDGSPIHALLDAARFRALRSPAMRRLAARAARALARAAPAGESDPFAPLGAYGTEDAEGGRTRTMAAAAALQVRPHLAPFVQYAPI